MQKMNSKVKTGVIIFVCICIGIIAYIQVDSYMTAKKIEADIKTHNEQIIKSFDDHQKKGNPAKTVERGTL